MKKNSHTFQRNIITCVILSIPFLILGCNGGSDSSSPITPPPTEHKRAPVVYPIILPDPISPLYATTISMKTAIDSDGPSHIQSVMLRQGSSSTCDNQPKAQDNSIMVHSQRSKSAEPALCAYDYTVESNDQTAQSTLAFAVSKSGALTPTLPWVGVIGAVGEDIPATISVPSGATLNASVLVLGDATVAPSVDATANTITLSSNTVGVTRVMYTVTNAGGEVQVGVVDFTVTQDVSVAPTAQRGDATLANATAEATYNLASFTPINGGSPVPLVMAKNSDGSDAGTSGLTITKIVPSLGISAEIVPPLSIKVTASRAGVFPIYYQITDGQGDIAYNLLNVVVEGATGLLVRDARYSLEPTTNPRTLKVNVADFAVTPSSVGQFELVANSVKITSKQAPSSTGYNATATQAEGSTDITYRYDGGNKNGISNITYQLKDNSTGLIADGNIFISIGHQLPSFSDFTVSGVAAGASPTTGAVLSGVATCDAATGCDNSKTKWTWRQSGDTVTTGVGPTESGYTVQYFPCEDNLELWATPVGTYTEGGVTKEVEGLPVRKSWVSPDVLTARLSKASAKEGEEVTLTIQACSEAPATVAITGGVDRQGRAQTDNLAKIKQADGTLVASEAVTIPTGGETSLTLVSPKGGLKSAISITSNGKSIAKDVTFSTITSPDVECANRYGFMANVFDGFTRPALACELVGKVYGTQPDVPGYVAMVENNETWKLFSQYNNLENPKAYCDKRFASIIPSRDELRVWATKSGPLDKAAGWPTLINAGANPQVNYSWYFTSTFRSNNQPWLYGLGETNFLLENYAVNSGHLVVCKAPAPIITTINNPATFPIDAGFPTTAFAGAKFKLNMSTTNAGYSFTSSDAVDAPVDNTGIITINDKPAGEVTITASKTGEADFEYKFTIEEFYSLDGVVNFVPAMDVCPNKGLTLPSPNQLSNGIENARLVGNILNEWGFMGNQGWVLEEGRNALFTNSIISPIRRMAVGPVTFTHYSMGNSSAEIYNVYCYK